MGVQSALHRRADAVIETMFLCPVFIGQFPPERYTRTRTELFLAFVLGLDLELVLALCEKNP